MCPRIVTRTSYCGNSFLTRSASPDGAAGQFAFGHQDDAAVLRFAESLLDEFAQLVDFRRDFRDDGRFGSRSDGSVQREESGFAPMTSMKKMRSCEVAVSRILSTDSTMVIQSGIVPDGRIRCETGRCRSFPALLRSGNCIRKRKSALRSATRPRRLRPAPKCRAL